MKASSWAALALALAGARALPSPPQHGTVAAERIIALRALAQEAFPPPPSPSPPLSWWDSGVQGLTGTVVKSVHEYFIQPLQWALENLLMPVANVLYTCAVIYAFLVLPLHAALVLGLATFMIGPSAMEGLLGLAWLVLELAASQPLVVIFAVWCILLLDTKVVRVQLPMALQRFARMRSRRS